jgi:hypothetical protein
MKSPSIMTLEGVIYFIDSVETSKDGKNWYPARPEGYPSLRYRIRAAWLVFTGRADALIWPDEQ